MKFVAALAVLATITLVSAQSQPASGATPCTTCLENSLQALPLCKGLDITMGELEPEKNAALVACLCSSLDGAWIDACTGADTCGQDISSFKNSYPDNLKGAGLTCGATPSFVSATRK